MEEIGKRESWPLSEKEKKLIDVSEKIDYELDHFGISDNPVSRGSMRVDRSTGEFSMDGDIFRDRAELLNDKVESLRYKIKKISALVDEVEKINQEAGK